MDTKIDAEEQHAGKAMQWVQRFVTAYGQLGTRDHYDIEILHDDAHVAYAYTEAKNLQPELAAVAYFQNADEAWVRETRRIGEAAYTVPAGSGPQKPEVSGEAVRAWVNACANALHQRLPGTSATDWMPTAAGLMIDGDAIYGDPVEAAAQWVQPTNADGSDRVPF